MASGLAPRLAEITGGDLRRVTPETKAVAAAAGDEPVAQAIERAARWLGIGGANVITALHLELVVLAGGVAGMGTQLLEPVQDEVRRRVRMFPPESVAIKLSRLGGRAGMHGGVALAMVGGAAGLRGVRRGRTQHEHHLRRTGQHDRPLAAAPTLTDREIEEGCRLATRYRVASVCVKPYAVRRCAELLRGTGVRIGCVVGFPHGSSATEVKRSETGLACRGGAEEWTW